MGLLVVLGTQLLATSWRVDRVEAVSARSTWSVDAPARDATSLTGYAGGQRRLIVPGHHNPSFWWITEAQIAAAEGRWRLRHVDYDASPEGRKMLRTSPYRWWLIGVGWGRRVITGEPLGLAIENGALWADPLLLGLVLIGGTWFCARCMGSTSGLMLAVGGGALFPLAAGFQPGAPDSHALAWVLALGSVLPLLVGGGRWAYVWAGALGGVGFWNSAETQTPLLALIGLGALGMVWLSEREAPAGAWRCWAGVGAIVILAASVFEFGWSDLWAATRPVSPLQAVGWWGLGELLTMVTRYRQAGRGAVSKAQLGLLVVGGVAILIWVAMALGRDGGGMLATDFYARELANHPRAESAGAKMAIVLSALALGVAGVMAWGRKGGSATRPAILLVAVAAVGVAVLGLMQPRWWNLFQVLVLAGLAVGFAGSKLRVGLVAAVLVLLMPGMVVGWPAAVKGGQVADLTPLEAQALVERDFAYWLKRREGAQPAVVFATPIPAGAMAYYGGIGTITSADGDNEEGLLTAVRLAAANTEQEIRVLLDSRRITHVVLPQWDPALPQLVRRGYGVPANEPLPRDAFVAALMGWDVPLWMRPMDYVTPNEEVFAGFTLTAFAVQAEQEPDLALSRLADFFVQRGQLTEAQGVRTALEAYPRSPVALIAMAQVDASVRDLPRLNDTLGRLVPMLSRRAARDLPADRRVSLAALLARVNRPELARTQIEATFRELDEAMLKTWTPGTVIDLLGVSRAVGVAWPAAELRDVAIKLIPPQVRAQM